MPFAVPTADMERVARRVQRWWRQREWQRALDEYAALTGMAGEPRAIATFLDHMLTDLEEGSSTKCSSEALMRATIAGREQRTHAKVDDATDAHMRRTLGGMTNSVLPGAACAAPIIGSETSEACGGELNLFSMSINRDMQMLQGAIGQIAPMSAGQERANAEGLNGQKLRYEVLSLRTRQQRKSALRVALGWSLNVSLLLMMLVLFLMYVCEFNARGGTAADHYLMHRELVLAWTWSVLQRVIFNEPLVILCAKGLPMLLRSRVCGCLFSETCVEYLAQIIEAGGAITRELV